MMLHRAGGVGRARAQRLPSKVRSWLAVSRLHGARGMLSINQPLANSAVEVWTGEAIGTGMRPVPQTGDDALDRIIADRFEAWTDRADYFGLEVVLWLAGDGGAAFLYRRRIFHLDGFGYGEELRLKALDPAQVNPALSMELPGGGLVIAGVEVDAGGKPVAFHIYRNWIPGLPLLRGLEIGAHRRCGRAASFQTGRGRADARHVAACVCLACGFGNWTRSRTASLFASRSARLLAGFVTDADGTAVAGWQRHRARRSTLEPGTMQRLQARRERRVFQTARDRRRVERVSKGGHS